MKNTAENYLDAQSQNTGTVEHYTKADFIDWIIQMESAAASKAEERETARKYYESSQAPESVPKKMTYVEEDLISDMVDYNVGQLVGGRIDFDMKAGEGQGQALIELVRDCLERNKFNERIKEPLANFFYVEGKPAIEIYHNPYKVGPYGVGIPEIKVVRPEKVLLDSDSEGWMHEDDIKRIKVDRVTLQYAKKKWGEDVLESSTSYTGNETEQYVDVHTIEYKEVEFYKNEEGYTLERDVFYLAVMVNRSKLVEGPYPTGLSRFHRIIPVIYKPRFHITTEPSGLVQKVKQSQDLINSSGSITYEAVKAAIKNFVYTIGATPDEEAAVKRQISRTNGYVNFTNASKVGVLEKSGIARELLQWYEMRLRAMNRISGQHDVERGETPTDLSGKAIQSLQQHARVPERVRQLHFEFALSEMVMALLEIFSKKMPKSFKIQRKIDGKKQDIYFNQPADEIENFIPDEYNNVDDNGIINDLTKIDTDNVDLKININLDDDAMDAYMANRSMVAFDRGLISSLDALRDLYPDDYQDRYDRKMQEAQATQLVQMIMENPELGAILTEGIQKFKQLTAETEGLNEQVKKSGRPSSGNIIG